MTREPASVKPAGPGGLALSREMKLVLLLLGMVALIGAWYLWTSTRAPAEETVVPTPPTAEGTPNAGTEGAGTPDGTGETGGVTTVTPAPNSEAGTPDQGGVNVATPGPVDVEVAPPFPDAETGTTAETAPKTPTPDGINPDTALASVPGQNPFQPLRVETDATASTPAASVPTPAPTASVPVPEAPVSVAPISVDPIGTSGGALSITPVPGSTTSSARPGTSGGLAFPTIPGSSTPPKVTITPIPASGGSVTSIPGTTIPGGTVSIPGSTVTPPPVAPPVAGVTAPTPTTPVPAGTPGDTVSSAPAAGNPQVITELGAAAPTPTPITTTSALDSALQTRGVSLNGVVLGPQSTAIFKGNDGFTVVSVGQTLPDSQITLKAVSATSATLALGNETKTLELDKR